jgi:hypothetical protein
LIGSKGSKVLKRREKGTQVVRKDYTAELGLALDLEDSKVISRLRKE